MLKNVTVLIHKNNLVSFILKDIDVVHLNDSLLLME